LLRTWQVYEFIRLFRKHIFLIKHYFRNKEVRYFSIFTGYSSNRLRMNIFLKYLIINIVLSCGIFQSVCSIPSSGRKIYFKNNVIDTLQFRKDLKCFNELNKTNYDSLLAEGYNLLEQSEKIKFDWGLFISNYEISFAYLQLGILDSAMNYANKTMKIARNDGDPEWLADSHKRLGSCYGATENYEQAISHYIVAEKIARANHFNELLIDVLNSKGILYRKMQDYKTAVNIFNSMLAEFPDTLSSFDRFRIINNIASVYYEQKRFEKAFNYFNQAMKYAKQTSDSIHIILVYQNIGNVLFKQNKLDEAEKYITKAIHYFEKTDQKSTLEMLLRTMGSIQSKKGDYANAEKYYIQSLNIAKQLDNIRLQSANYHNLGINFKRWRTKEPKRFDLFENENACLSYELAFKDSIYKMESSEKMHELEKKYETEKKNNQIALLEKETEAQQNRQIFMFIGMVILIALIGILVVSFQYVRKTNNMLTAKNRWIESQKQQIQDQNKQLEVAINTQNKLFSIIAHDLRSPLASISNINILLKIALNKKNFDMVEELTEKLGQRNTQVLQLTDNLLNWASSQTGRIKFNHSDLNLKTIAEESVSVFEESLAQKNISIEMQIPDNIHVFADSISVKTIFRNLVNNAVKFTKPGGSICISYFPENNDAVVKISDNGIGIPENMQKNIFDITDKKQQSGTMGEKSSGLGLLVCKEFVARNNGRIWFTSKEGQGTDFYVSLPLFHEDA